MFIKKLIANNVQTKVKRLHQSEIATSFQDRFKCYLPPTESGKSPVSSHAPRPPPDDFAERRHRVVVVDLVGLFEAILLTTASTRGGRAGVKNELAIPRNTIY